MEPEMYPDDQKKNRPGKTKSNRIRLETPRLNLHKPHRNDLSAIAREIGNAQVACNLATVPHPYSFIDATNWFAGINANWAMNSFTFGIYEKTRPDELIGVASINNLLATRDPRPTLAYWLALDHWGQGLMSEAVGALLAFAFERLNVPVVEATYLKENPASGRVMEKNGFQRVEPTMQWSRYRMAYRSGYLMRCEKITWQQASKKLNALSNDVGEC
jgi:RimJ/RimL family protein N-acetyltransferase